MNQIFNWVFRKDTLLKLLSEELYHLFVTAVFVFIAIKIKETKPDNISWIAVVLLIILFVLLNFMVRIFNYWDREKKQESSKEIDVEFRTNLYAEDVAYEISLQEVKKAKNRIIIVADYSPPFEPLQPTQERQQYYLEIERKLAAKKDTGFYYTRIMQRDLSNFADIRNKNGMIDDFRLIIGDEQAFAHCKRVLEIARQNRKLKIKIIISRNVPSLPSILVVDNNKMLFTIPKRVPGPDVKTAGVLNFTDNTQSGSAIVEKFIQIVSTINEETNEALLVNNIKNFEEEEFQKWYRVNK